MAFVVFSVRFGKKARYRRVSCQRCHDVDISYTVGTENGTKHFFAVAYFLYVLIACPFVLSLS